MWAMRASMASGVVSGLFTRWVANAAMLAARACCWVPFFWFDRLNRPSNNSGWAANIRP